MNALNWLASQLAWEHRLLELRQGVRVSSHTEEPVAPAKAA